MPEQPVQKRTEGISDYIPLIVPTVLAVLVVYFLFPQYNDAGIRNDLAASNIKFDGLITSKVNITEFDGKLSDIKSFQDNTTNNLTLQNVVNNNINSRIINTEQNISDIKQQFGGMNLNVSSLSSSLTATNATAASLQNQITLLLNSTTANYTDIRGNLSILNSNQSDMRGAVSTLITVQGYIQNNQTILQNRIDRLNETMQKLCLFNSSWC